MKQVQKGFTLVEILVAIILLGVTITAIVKTFNFLYAPDRLKKMSIIRNMDFQFTQWVEGNIDVSGLKSPGSKYTIAAKMDSTATGLNKYNLKLLHKSTHQTIVELITARVRD